MISLTCTHCKAVLTMDDAFAGGACRCHHCGTIQTVPTRLKGSAKAPASGKALYRNKARDGNGTLRPRSRRQHARHLRRAQTSLLSLDRHARPAAKVSGHLLEQWIG